MLERSRWREADGRNFPFMIFILGTLPLTFLVRTRKHLRNLRQLSHLFLAGTKVTDDGIRQLESLSELETLTLVDTQVTDASLEVLKEWKVLKELRVARSKVTEAGVAYLRTLRPQMRISW